MMGGEKRTEKPVHLVTFAQPFYLAKTETTFTQYDAFSEATARDFLGDASWGRSDRPVIFVGWSEAKAYANWLTAMTGEACRLPTEAEWEYAARAGTATRYPWGDEPGTNLASFVGAGIKWNAHTVPVGSFAPNAFGLHDMIGNAWEWVGDCWHENYEGAPDDGLAWVEDRCQSRVLRGGSWDASAEIARSAYRFSLVPAYRLNSFGFRVMCLSPIE
jgi:formylglycine-generating enzyme required for sulfatase activity